MQKDNAILTIKELFEEFEELHNLEPQLKHLENTFKIIESKYWNIKKQPELIADRLVEDDNCDEEQLSANRKVGESLKDQYLNIAKQFTTYQKKFSPPVPSSNTTPESLETMTVAVTEMAEVLEGTKSSGLERLSVPICDGSRRSYPTWKKEFNHWMGKYAQDKDEQL